MEKRPSLLRAISARQRFILAVICCFQILDGFDLFALALVASDIAYRWHISIPLVGFVLAAAQLGSILSAAVVGRLTERHGARRLLLIVAAIFALSSLLTGIAWDFFALLVSRLLIGLGLGAAMPLTVGYLSTQMPRGVRGACIGIALAGLPAGQILCGIVASFVVPIWGWRALFLVGALAAILLFPLILQLPAGSADAGEAGTENPLPSARPTLRPYRTTIVLTASAAFASALIIYFLFSWVPFLLTRSGLPPSQASICTSALAAGGLLGGIIIGRLSDVLPCNRILSAAYCLGGLLMAWLGWGASGWIAILLLCAGVGFCIFGAYASLSILIAMIFPDGTHVRIVGYSTIATRSAGLIAPIGAGFLLAQGFGPQMIFSTATILAVIVAILLWTLVASLPDRLSALRKL